MPAYLLAGKEAFFLKHNEEILAILGHALENIDNNSIIVSTVELIKIAVRMFPKHIAKLQDPLAHIFFLFLSEDCPRSPVRFPNNNLYLYV